MDLRPGEKVGWVLPSNVAVDLSKPPPHFAKRIPAKKGVPSFRSEDWQLEFANQIEAEDRADAGSGAIDSISTNSSGASIDGRVTDSGGAGVSSVSVSAYVFDDRWGSDSWNSVDSERTSSGGYYSIEGLEADTYRVCFSHDDYLYECYDNATNVDDANDITVADGQNVAGIDAVFGGEEWVLTVSVAGNGTVTSNPTGISCGSDCTELYPYVTDVTLTAIPVSGSVFAGWSGGCSGTEDACNLRITDDVEVTATFNTSGTGDCTVAPRRLSAEFASGDHSYRSESLITVAGSANVGASATLTLAAPSIHFEPGFRVARGGQLSALAGAVTCSSTSRAVSESPIEFAYPTGLSGGLRVLSQLSSLGIDLDTIASSLSDSAGRWLVIETTQALVTSDANQQSDIYQLDLLTHQLTLISACENGHSGNGASRHAAVDASGELIVFHSEANDLVSGDNNTVSDIFLRDLALGYTERLTDASVASAHPGIDASGTDVVYDQRSDEGRRAIMSSRLIGASEVETLSLAADDAGSLLDNHHPALSADGRFVAYLEQATSAAGSRCQVHLFDRATKVDHRQPCPQALADQPELARAVFGTDARTIDWLLPGQMMPLTLSNPLMPPSAN